MFMILLFVLKLLLISLGIGVVLAILFSVPQMIFAFPYCLWVGGQNCAGKYLELKDEPITRSTRNAFRLYKSFITKKPPVF